MDPSEIPPDDHKISASVFSSNELRRARIATGWLFFAFGMGMATWASRLPSIKEQAGVSNGELGLALLAVPLVTVSTMRLIGRWAHHYGSSPVAILGTVALAIAIIFPGIAHSFLGLVFALCILGFALSTCEIGINTHSVTVEHEYRRPIVAGFHALWSAGSLVGAAFGAFGAFFGWAVSHHLLVAGIVIGLATVGLSGWLLPADVDSKQPEEPHASRKSQPWTKAQFLLGMVAFCSFFAEGASADWSAVYMHDVLLTTEATAALAFMFYSFAMCIARFAGDNLITRLGRVKLLRFGGLLGSIGLLVGLAQNNFVVMLIGWMLLGVGLSLSAPIAFSAAGSLSNVARGIAIARVSGMGYIGMLIGPPLIGGVAQLSSLRIALCIPAILAFGLTLFASAANSSYEKA